MKFLGALGVDFSAYLNYNKGVQKSEVMQLSPRTGRPKLDDPKVNRTSVNLDRETLKKLEAYCTEHGITKGEAIRRGIHLLLDKETK